LDQLDCLMSVVRSFDSSEEFPLQSLKPIAFSDRHVELLTFRCRYVRLDSEVKTYLLSILFLFSEILLVDETRYLQVIPVRFPDEISVG